MKNKMNHAISNLKITYENCSSYGGLGKKSFYYEKIDPEPHRYEDSWSFGSFEFFEGDSRHSVRVPEDRLEQLLEGE